MSLRLIIVLCTLPFLFACASEKPSKEVELSSLSTKNQSNNDNILAIDLDHVMGKFQPSEHEDFTLIENTYASREGMFLHRKTYMSFKAMHAAAKKDGISLTIRSATRNFFDQKRIWENKWSGKTLVESGQNLAESVADAKERALIILKYSSMPGSSRHHWGTDIDINNFENSYFESGQGLKEYEWLVANAPSFGFCQPYTARDAKRPNGYNEEKWHWSYLPVAIPLTKFASQHLTNKDIQGFLGSETANDIDIKNNYILGINQACLGSM